MPASIREQIIAAAVARIDAAIDAPVYRSRVAALAAGQLPAVVVSPEADTPGGRDDAPWWIEWELALSVDVLVAVAPPDQEASALVGLCHAALLQPPAGLGVAGVTDVVAAPVEFLAEPSGEATGVTRLALLVRYRTQPADLAAVP